MTQDEKNVLIKSQRINRWSAQKLYYNNGGNDNNGNGGGNRTRYYIA